MNIFKKIMGGNDDVDEKIQSMRQEAHEIKNQMTAEALEKQRKVNKYNRGTLKTLEKMQSDLIDATYVIAIATGARKRGLR